MDFDKLFKLMFASCFLSIIGLGVILVTVQLTETC